MFAVKLHQEELNKHKDQIKGGLADDKTCEDIAKKHPNNTAITFRDSSITYKKLNEKANRVAQEILKKSTQNKIVGLCIERSLD